MIGALFFPILVTPLTVTLKEFISDQNVVIVRIRKLSDPYDYDCDPYNVAYDSSYDYDFPIYTGF